MCYVSVYCNLLHASLVSCAQIKECIVVFHTPFFYFCGVMNPSVNGPNKNVVGSK